MNLLVLYLLLLKATLTSLTGMSSLPVLRNDLVVTHHLLTDRQLNAAVATGQMSPGPYGIYVVSVGYFAAGIPGACCAWLAVITPAFLIIPMLRYLGSRARRPRVQGAIQGVTMAAAGLIVATAVPLARDAVTGVVAGIVAAVGFFLLVTTKLDTLWVIAVGAAVGMISSAFM